jgi:Fe-S-cluster containining protein
MRLSLSVLEKFLLKSGFEVTNHCDAASGLVLCTARREADQAFVTYPHPLYEFRGLDRDQCTLRMAGDVAAIWGLTPEALALKALAEFDLPPQGFACTRCGRCCLRLGDAARGRIAPEQVREWEAAGLTRILRLVRRVDRPAYVFYEAWVNPRTGRHFKRCPWLARLPGGGRGCAIHEHKPLKCRAYPYDSEGAQRQGCPGFDEVPEFEAPDFEVPEFEVPEFEKERVRAKGKPALPEQDAP